MERQRISIEELREDFPNIVTRVGILGQEVEVTKNGKSFAVLRPLNGGMDEPVSPENLSSQLLAAH